MNNYQDDNKQASLPEMTFERLRNDTKASVLRIVCQIGSVLLVIVAAFGLYKYSTKMPDGITNQNQIMDIMAPLLDSQLKSDLAIYPEQIRDEADVNCVFLYKNARTKRYVFPIKDKKTGEIHYCYLAAYVSPQGYMTKKVNDIFYDKWSMTLDEEQASIEGDNPPVMANKYTILEYYREHSNVYDEWFNDEI